MTAGPHPTKADFDPWLYQKPEKSPTQDHRGYCIRHGWTSIKECPSCCLERMGFVPQPLSPLYKANLRRAFIGGQEHP